MEPVSPPKRVTRARAAAKASELTTRTARVITPAAKTQAAATTKRKAASQNIDGDDEEDELGSTTTMSTARATTRGRPRKVPEASVQMTSQAVEAAQPVARPTRGRPRKVVQDAQPDVTTKTTRASRAKNTQTAADDAQNNTALANAARTTRGRAASSAKSAAAKKTVKFEEPDKENIVPTATKAKATSTEVVGRSTGLRARPVRKPVTASRSTARVTARATATDAADGKKPMPLSPKKITQIPIRREVDSDDELAMTGQTPIKPLSKSPIKPPPGSTNSLQLTSPTKPMAQAISPGKPSRIMLGTPARRPPPPPFKDVMRSPPKRVEGLATVNKESDQELSSKATSTLSSSLFGSPAKRPASPIKSLLTTGQSDITASSLKISLLGSPAKRGLIQSAKKPPSSAKVLGQEEGPSTVQTTLESVTEEISMANAPKLRFPGRLSAVLPRSVDPALTEDASPLSDEHSEGPDGASDEVCLLDNVVDGDVHDDRMVVDIPETQDIEVGRVSTTPPHAPTAKPDRRFALREKDLDPYQGFHVESEDELASSWGSERGRPSSYSVVQPLTPSPALAVGNIATQSGRRLFQPQQGFMTGTDEELGFTPLARQLGDWTTSGLNIQPLMRTTEAATEGITVPGEITVAAESNTAMLGEPTIHFFEDQMSFHDHAVAQSEQMQVPVTVTAAEDDEVDFDDVVVTGEDLALAAEAQEMSLLDTRQLGEMVDLSPTIDDTASEASQEYGDENAIPIDPAILGQGSNTHQLLPVTPQRIITREFHTVSKVPLKAPDESTPKPQIRRRSMSVSRLPVQRPSRPTQGLMRNATVISYSPTKRRTRSSAVELVEHSVSGESRGVSEPPVTPAKSETGWSTSGTPARTPRRDVNPALLRGAVVFVDVHTSEGADASGIFVELLTQMGARCVKSWPWNPSSPPGKATASSSRIGITHVVYKDGGKRTLEKVRETAGVVQCVGVSWVLDCERENEWLQEGPYYIDTSCVPRGGGRRRKSMEPTALANLNGMLVPTPVRAGTVSRDAQSLPATPANSRRRRQSGLWERTPEKDNVQQQEVDQVETNWDATLVLTPVPKTPAPEAVARFAASMPPETPSADSEGDTLMSVGKDHLLTRTCPAKSNAFQDLGEGVLAKEKDEGVLMRLMAARRKSLQYVPKVGSPLAKAWE